MQARHINREQYFEELAITSRKYHVPLIQLYHDISSGSRILEIGCGDGGNLLPFAEMGCEVAGVDLSVSRIRDAKRFFEDRHVLGRFIEANILAQPDMGEPYDIIICHDVYEHIENKSCLLNVMGHYLRPDGVVLIAFPAWQMPFGGHQQICHNPVISKVPFIHLLPEAVYRYLLKLSGESPECIADLLSIKQTKVTIEEFEKHIAGSDLFIAHRDLWLINPHYEIKFGLKAMKLHPLIAGIPYLRNWLSSSCGYVLKKA